jgi:hypothetical protein
MINRVARMPWMWLVVPSLFALSRSGRGYVIAIVDVAYVTSALACVRSDPCVCLLVSCLLSFPLRPFPFAWITPNPLDVAVLVTCPWRLGGEVEGRRGHECTIEGIHLSAVS